MVDDSEPEIVPPHAKHGAPRLQEAALASLLGRFPEWRRDGDVIERRVTVADFRTALRLVNEVGAAAEEEDHHPDLAIEGWNRVTVRLTTHDAGGLTTNDFVLARAVEAAIASCATP